MKLIAAIVGLLLSLMAGGANASVFEGRNALNQIDLTCTVSGASKCTSFYDSTLNITILNDWGIGASTWDGSASPPYATAQGIAAAAGLAATGLSGWVLPTGDADSAAGALNQYKSIMQDVGSPGTYGVGPKLNDYFHGVRAGLYWSGTGYSSSHAWYLGLNTFNGSQDFGAKTLFGYAVAVRDGDVAALVPEPATLVLLSLSLGAIGLVARRKQD